MNNINETELETLTKRISALEDVVTRGRKIQVKQGLSADFTDDKVDVGEFGLLTDTNELRMGMADGTSIQVNGGGDIPDASTTEKGIVQLVDNLTSDDDTKALTAKQGKALKQAIDASSGNIREYNTTITTEWDGNEAPYTQEVVVNGILATDNPFIQPIFNTDNVLAISESEEWSEVGKILTSDNKITVTCFENKPSIPINIFIMAVN